ncbi:MAG: PQQ-binding-like beta-propeller repeat protein [Planctomycetota bacterium]|nr:PQQ-binding-like beta-propeller repeat protein [Planctomycetota bacterium]
MKNAVSTIMLSGWFMLTFVVTLSAQDNWTRFRGENGNGVVSDDPRLPVHWSAKENVQWKTKILGWGWGSPVVWGDRVFVTAVHSDQDYEKPKGGLYLGQGRAAPPDTVHHWMIYCLSLDDGKIIWQHEAYQGKPEVPRHPKSTYAAETPTIDGDRLYVLFGDLGLYCLDLDGQPLWKQMLTPRKTLSGYGAAASPVVYENQVIIVYDNEQESFISAYDTVTGKIRWKVPRNETSTWATPFVWKHADGIEIVVCGRKQNRAYSPTGELLWHFDGKMSVLTIPSPFVVNDLLYITSGYFQDNKRPVYAIKPGARGDISLKAEETSNEFISWSLQRMGPYNTSPIVYKGNYYTLLDRGMLTCHNARTGELIFNRTRFPQGASFTASPWAYNGKLFFLDENGTTHVMPAGGEFKIESTNELDELCIATPAISQGKLLLRTASSVYCISRDNP